MRIIIIILTAIRIVTAQEYSITILGFNATDVIQNNEDSISISFKAQNRGIFDFIWPTNNYYRTIYNAENFSVQSWEKVINQGKLKEELSGTIDIKGKVEYNDGTSFKSAEETYNILSLIALVQHYNKDFFDTKWFDFEHDGSIGEARFLWSDSVSLFNVNDSILCDHYRLDINISDTTKKVESSDYFMDNIIREDIVREIWVSRYAPRRIVKAQIKISGLSIVAHVISNK